MEKYKKLAIILGMFFTFSLNSNMISYAQEATTETVQPAGQEQTAQEAAALVSQDNQNANQAQEAAQGATSNEGARENEAQGAAAQEATAQATTQRSAQTTRRRTTTTQTSEAQEETKEEDTSPKTEEGKYLLTFIKNSNLRSAPSTSGESLVIIPYSIRITASSKTTNENGEVWYKLSYGGMEGYVREDLVSAEALTADENQDDQQDESPENTEEITEDNTSNETPEETATVDTDPSAAGTSQTLNSEEAVNETKDSTLSEATSEENISKRKLDGFMVLFILAGIAGLFLALFIYLKLAVEYKKSRAYIIKKIMRGDNNI